MNKIIYQSDDVAKIYKYRLWRLFENLTVAQRKKAKQVLPVALNTSWRTIEKWLYIRIDDNKTIPADKLYQLSTFFKTNVNLMWTKAPESLYKERLLIEKI